MTSRALMKAQEAYDKARLKFAGTVESDDHPVHVEYWASIALDRKRALRRALQKDKSP